MNHEERRHECMDASEVAELAVKRTFAILGVDVDEPKDVEAFRETLRFAGKLNRVADHGLMAVVGTVVVALLAALWAGIGASMGHRP